MTEITETSATFPSTSALLEKSRQVLSIPTLPKLEPAVISLIAGWGAGTAEALTCHPLDTVKVGMQIRRQLPGQYRGGLGSQATEAIRHILRNQGVGGFYSGLGPVVLLMGPKIAIRFASFEMMKSVFQKPNQHLSTSNALVCGLTAGVVEAVTIVTPMEVIKIKLQSGEIVNGHRKYRNVPQTVSTIISESGFRGLYNGLALTAARQSTNQAAAFGTYSTLKAYLEKQQDGEPLSGWKVTAVGFAAGVSAPSVNTPLDTVKTRMQRSTPIPGQSEMQRARIIFLNCLRNEGALALYKGCLPRIVRAAPAQAVTFTVYEAIKDFLSSQ